MITYKRVIEHINYFSFLVLLCAMPFPWQFIRFFGLVWAVTWLLELRFIDRANLQLTKERVFVAIGFGVWFLWSILSVLWAENKSLSWTFIQRDYYILLIRHSESISLFSGLMLLSTPFALTQYSLIISQISNTTSDRHKVSSSFSPLNLIV